MLPSSSRIHELVIGRGIASAILCARAALLVSFCGVSASADFFMDDDGSKWSIFENSKPILTYVYREGTPAGVGGGFLSPLFDNTGRPFTSTTEDAPDAPPGMMFGWSECRVGPRSVDMLARDDALHVYERTLASETTSDAAMLHVQHGWVFADTREAFLMDTIRFDVHPARKTHRTIDVEYTVTNVGRETFLLGAGGGMFVTMDTKRVPSLVVTTAPFERDGLAPWADVSARIPRSSRYTGVSFFMDPAMPPQTLPDWAANEDGGLAALWPRRGSIKLEPGERAAFRFRMFLHLGRGQDQDVNTYYFSYASEREGAQ